MSEPAKPNCYECKYRGSIPGDAHSRCNHPTVKQDGNPFGAIVDMLSGKNVAAQIQLRVQGDATGIRRGWFMWPANFDPAWLVSCDGFEKKEIK
jgi:hypothetical protein